MTPLAQRYCGFQLNFAARGSTGGVRWSQVHSPNMKTATMDAFVPILTRAARCSFIKALGKLFLIWCVLSLFPVYAIEQSQRVGERAGWFHDAKFGLFVHWGLYAIPGGEWRGKTDYSEWIQEETRMPNSFYEQYAGQFNPIKFDAKQWVQLVKSAGMKYLVITAKHHEGFCMFDTGQTDYNVVKATPWKRDPLKELAAACRESGLKLGVFYSIPDWHHPEMPAQYNQSGFHGNRNPQADIWKYAEYVRNQIRELLTGYGPVAVLWFDGGESFIRSTGSQPLDYDRLVRMIHELQPGCLINDRLGMEADFRTAEQGVPYGYGMSAFEVCMTLNNHWGYNKADQHWKPAGRVIRQLVETVSRGGNYLLNVGPTADGEFPGPAVAILNEVGRWLEVNGEGIYGTTGSPFLDPFWGGCTKKVTPEATTIYLQVLNWPTNGSLMVPGLKNTVQEAYLLTIGGHKALATRATAEGVAVAGPAAAPDPNGSTVALKIGGALGLEPQLIPRSADGSYTLTAAEGVRHGTQVKYDEAVDRGYISNWVDPEEWVEWGLQVAKAGRYSVQAVLAASESASFNISAGDQTLSVISPGTDDPSRFHVVTLGVVEMRSRGKTMLSMRPVKDGWHPLLLKGLQLKPAGAASAP